MRIFFLTTLVCISACIMAQSPTITLPELVPPSPDVAAITKGAELAATPHTGAANASIPIYQLKVGAYTLPVSINYSGNGFKPNEIPSRVGSGWSLGAGGVVSRIQRGKPDDFCTTPTPKTISQLLQYDAAALTYISDLEDQASYHDAQPDEYRYSVNGVSGKFIIKRDGNILQVPYNNVKIVVTGGTNATAVDQVVITDESGVIYKFGTYSAIEETTEHNLTNNMVNKQHIRTAWMLTKIILPTGEYIDFSYSQINHWSVSGEIKSASKAVSQNGPCNIDDEPPCVGVTSTSTKVVDIKYKSYYLTSIVASTGPSVTFSYEDRPDVGGDNRLTGITVSYGAAIIKSVELQYQSAAGSQPLTDVNGKFFLKKVKFNDPTGGGAPSQEYSLAYYYDLVEWDTPGGEDHLGFATNGTSSTPPPPLTADEQLFSAYYTSRYPNGNISKIGMLKRITYPTGGYDEFSYEPNMAFEYVTENVKDIRTVRISHNGIDGQHPIYWTTFTPSRTQTAEFYLRTHWDGPAPIPSGSPAPKSATAWVYNNSTNEVVAMRRAEGFETGYGYYIDGTVAVTLTGGVTYRLELEIRLGEHSIAQADLVYDAGNTTANVKKYEELCGIRVNRITSYDPVTDKSVSKYYKYENLFDPTQCSALKLYYPEYITWNVHGVPCGFLNYEKRCNSKVWSNNSVTSTYVNDAGGVIYKWVVESDDPGFANGGVQHYYDYQGEFVGAIVIGSAVPQRPTALFDLRNGRDVRQDYFNKDLQLVKKVTNNYSYDVQVDEMQQLNFIVRKKWEILFPQYPVDQSSFDPYDVMQYSVWTHWDHLDNVTVEEYDIASGKVMSTTTTYQYGTPANVQPAVVKQLGSDGVERKTIFKYPTDYNTQVAQDMVTKNMRTAKMEEAVYKDSKLLFKTNTDYKDWFSNQSIITPELVKVQKNSNSQETRIHYYQYSTGGNPIELSKENDQRISYIWDYNGNYPVAEVTNASYGSGIAYTSFEADGKGGWTFSGSTSTDGSEPAGKKSYAISGGNITYTTGLTSGKKYYVTYWSKDGAGTITVNGSGGTSMLTKSGWTLYRKTITYSGSGGITVSGSGRLDELRLFPDGAFMKSFTYTPEVGITSAADNNGLIQKYEYDAFNRLLRIRDMDNNILKQVEYTYGAAIPACANATPNWQFTGNYRCVKVNAWGNDNTGEREREERDLNNCSPTYHQYRWVSVGASGSCPVVGGCVGVDKRVIAGVCRTGCKVIVASEYIGNLQWRCTYHYYWEDDGYYGPDMTEINDSHCVSNCN